ncbi:MAG TPA: molybdate ABC transporter substrate-binding protein [Desulfomicrobiaceae bacterium]|nr:molybdate ABC transporter substrate-binding protein [Desulfomicrobiaceae bacterium]
MRLLLALLMTMCVMGTGWAGNLKIYSGAGLIKPMEEFRGNFEKTHDVQLDIHYGSSGELFGLLGMGQTCDVLIPGAAKYTEDAVKNGWIEKGSVHRLVKHIPVIAVPAGNPAGIHALEDLARPGVKLAMGDPKGPAIGRVANKIFKKNGLAKRIKPNVQVLAPTVNQLLIYVALGQVDAALIWGDLVTWAEGKGKLEVVDILASQNMIKTIPTGVGSSSASPEMAHAFNDYIGSAEGMAIWKKHGFAPCSE